MHVPPRRRGRDPLALSARHGGAPVQAGGQLAAHKGQPPAHPLDETGIEGPRLGLQDPHLHGNAGGLQDLQSLARHQGVGIDHGGHHAPHPRREQGVGAGRGPALVAAGFQGDIGGGAAGPPPRGRQRDALGVGGADAVVVTLTDDLPGADQDTAYPWVGIGGEEPQAREPERPRHVGKVPGVSGQDDLSRSVSMSIWWRLASGVS